MKIAWTNELNEMHKNLHFSEEAQRKTVIDL